MNVLFLGCQLECRQLALNVTIRLFNVLHGTFSYTVIRPSYGMFDHSIWECRNS